jgi:hypothetical protein
VYVLGPFNSANIVSNEKIILAIILLCLPARAPPPLYMRERESICSAGRSPISTAFTSVMKTYSLAQRQRDSLSSYDATRHGKIAIGGWLIYSLVVAKISYMDIARYLLFELQHTLKS